MYARRPLVALPPVLLCLLSILCVLSPGHAQSNTAAQIKPLQAELKDKAEGVRLQAILNLGSMGTDAASAVSDLIPMLKDSDATVRANAASALGRIGPKEPTILPAL